MTIRPRVHPESVLTGHRYIQDEHTSDCVHCGHEIRLDGVQWVSLLEVDNPQFCAQRLADMVRFAGMYTEDLSEAATHAGFPFGEHYEWLAEHDFCVQLAEARPSLYNASYTIDGDYEIALSNDIVDVMVEARGGILTVCFIPKEDAELWLLNHWLSSLMPWFRQTFKEE